jgi:hypothetical protein
MKITISVLASREKKSIFNEITVYTFKKYLPDLRLHLRNSSKVKRFTKWNFQTIIYSSYRNSWK